MFKKTIILSSFVLLVSFDINSMGDDVVGETIAISIKFRTFGGISIVYAWNMANK